MDSSHVTSLRFWQRFPFRITLLFAVPVYAFLIVIAVLFTLWGRATELGNLQARLHGLTVALSTRVPVEAGQKDQWDAADREAVRAVFGYVASQEPDVSSIYVLRPTSDPGVLEFAVDWVREGEAAALDEPYEAAQAPRLLAAFVDGPQVEAEVYTDKWGSVLSGFAPVLDAQGHTVAVVGCDITAGRMDEILGRVVRSSVVMFGVVFVGISIVGLIVAQNVRVPLDRMVGTMERIGRGDLKQRVLIDRTDEFGVLAGHLDRMAAGLQEREYIRDIFGRYVSEDVARSVLANADGARLGGEVRVVTILFSDIQRYSTIAEHLEPTQVVSMLNEYMGAMGEVVDAHDGVVIEFLGDAILAVFGAPQPHGDHAERAVACARAMEARLIELNRTWEASGVAALWKRGGVDQLRARIGIHTGPVVAGNMGGATRVKYAVIGDAVNVASRVEGLNNELGTRVLITSATADALSAATRSALEPRGSHLVKGREQPVDVWTLR